MRKTGRSTSRHPEKKKHPLENLHRQLHRRSIESLFGEAARDGLAARRRTGGHIFLPSKIPSGEMRVAGGRLRPVTFRGRKLLCLLSPDSETEAAHALRKQAVEELEKSEHKFRMLVEIMNEGLGMQDENGLLTYVNDRFAGMLGYRPEELVGRPLRSLYADGQVYSTQISARRTGERATYEIDLIKRDGLKIPTIISAAPVIDPEGNYRGSIGVIMDIRERKRAETALENYAAQLEIMNRDLKNFVFVASHDLQEPLRKIRTFGDRLHQRCGCKLDETEKDYLERIEKAAHRMQHLIRDLQKYLQITTRKERFERVDFHGLVEGVVCSLGPRIREIGARVEVGALPAVDADAIQMKYLFQQLLDNALKYRMPGRPPLIRIFSTSDAKTCRIFVQDNGIGFPEQYLDRIFVPLQRLHAGTGYTGTGMGLAVCRKIVERHGGTITARSTPEVGTTFIIELNLVHS